MIFETVDFLKKSEAPSSKSECIRALICSALCDEPTKIFSSCCSDTDVCADALRALGAKVLKDETGYVVYPGEYEPCVDTTPVNFRDCATALRLIHPTATILNPDFSFKATDRLLERVENTLLTFDEIISDVTSLSADKSSQTLSGLLIAKTITGGSVAITGNSVSQQYVDLTVEILSRFGAKIHRSSTGYTVYPKEKLVSPGTYKVNGDFSGSAFLLAAGLIGKEPVSVKGLYFDNVSSIDREIVVHLKRMGGNIEIGTDKITAYPSALRGIDFYADECPDLVPVIAVCAACAKGKTEVFEIERLRLKESDRIETIIDLLDAFGIESSYKDKKLTICGNPGKRLTCRREIDTHDHRIAMAAFVLASVSENGLSISDIDCINKSFPSFLKNTGVSL